MKLAFEHRLPGKFHKSPKTILPFPRLSAFVCVAAFLGGSLVEGQSLSNALDTPRRAWTLTTETGITTTTTTEPTATFDGQDALVVVTTTNGARALLTSTVIGPAIIRYEKSATLNVALASNSGAPVSTGVLFGYGPMTFTLTLTGNGSLDKLLVMDSSRPITLAQVLAQPGVTWSESGVAPWRGVSDTEGGASMALLSPRLPPASSAAANVVSLNASMNGPRQFLFNTRQGYPTVNLVGAEDRPLTRFGLPLAGPVAVRFDFRAVEQAGNGNVFYIVDSLLATPTQTFGEVMNFPDVTWSTGGDMPWLPLSPGAAGPVASGTTAVSGTVQRGEASWLQAAVTGPGVARFKTRLLDAAGDRIAQIRVNGVPAPLATDGNNQMAVHVPAGIHTLRWELLAAPDERPFTTNLSLQDFSWTPTPADDFATAATASGATPYPWLITQCGTGLSWQIATDGPRTALTKLNPCGSSIRLMVPGFGLISAAWKAENFAGAGSYLMGPKLSSFGNDPTGNFDWTTVTGNFGLRLSNLLATVLVNQPAWRTTTVSATAWLDDVSWTPPTTTTLVEALDAPGLMWTSGGTRADIFQGLTGLAVEGALGNDAVVCAGLLSDEIGWMETIVTGPGVLAAKATTTHPSLRLLVDGVSVGRQQGTGATFLTGQTLLAPALAVPIPAGAHTVRFEVSGQPGWRETDFAALDNVSLTAATVPEIAPLLETTELTWAANRAVLSNLAPSAAQDGEDGLSLSGPGSSSLSTVVTGPAILSYWWKAGAGGPSGANFTLMLDQRRTIASLHTTQTAWQQVSVPLPAGTHDLTFHLAQNGNTFHLDNFALTALSTLSLATAFDQATGTFSEGMTSAIGSAAYGALAFDASDAVFLHDRQANGSLRWVPPGPGLLTLRARTLIGTGEIRFDQIDSPGTTTATWAVVSHRIASRPALDGITITANSPMLLDAFTFVPDTPQSQESSPFYASWLATQGLTEMAAPPGGDLDGDGLSNALEHAFGLAIAVPDAAQISSGDISGLPDVQVINDTATGLPFLEVSFIGLPGGTIPLMTYRIESAESAAGDGSSLNWSPSPTAPTLISTVAGKRKFLWRSPASIIPGGREFVRVRSAAE